MSVKPSLLLRQPVLFRVTRRSLLLFTNTSYRKDCHCRVTPCIHEHAPSFVVAERVIHRHRHGDCLHTVVQVAFRTLGKQRRPTHTHESRSHVANRNSHCNGWVHSRFQAVPGRPDWNQKKVLAVYRISWVTRSPIPFWNEMENSHPLKLNRTGKWNRNWAIRLGPDRIKQHAHRHSWTSSCTVAATIPENVHIGWPSWMRAITTIFTVWPPKTCRCWRQTRDTWQNLFWFLYKAPNLRYSD